MNIENYYITWQIIDTMVVGCLIMDNSNSEILGNGVSICGKKDTFSKDFGRKLSLSRAIKAAEVPKKDRKLIWESYRTMTKIPRW